MIREDKKIVNPEKVIFTSIKEWFITFEGGPTDGGVLRINNILKWRHHEKSEFKVIYYKMKIAFGGESFSLFIRRNPHQDRGSEREREREREMRRRRKSLHCRSSASTIFGLDWEVLWRLGQRRTQTFAAWKKASKDLTIYCSCHHEPTTKLKANEYNQKKMIIFLFCFLLLS